MKIVIILSILTTLSVASLSNAEETCKFVCERNWAATINTVCLYAPLTEASNCAAKAEETKRNCLAVCEAK